MRGGGCPFHPPYVHRHRDEANGGLRTQSDAGVPCWPPRYLFSGSEVARSSSYAERGPTTSRNDLRISVQLERRPRRRATAILQRPLSPAVAYANLRSTG